MPESQVIRSGGISESVECRVGPSAALECTPDSTCWGCLPKHAERGYFCGPPFPGNDSAGNGSCCYRRRPVRSQTPHATHKYWRYRSSRTRQPVALGCAVACFGFPSGFCRVGRGLGSDMRLPVEIAMLIKLHIDYVLNMCFTPLRIPLYVIDMVKRSIAYRLVVDTTMPRKKETAARRTTRTRPPLSSR